MQRCYNPKNEHYGYYGGAGVTVCDRWRGKDGFKNFRADVGRRPVNTSIGRFDDMGNYEPGNCKWMTVKEQKLEQRKKNKRWRHNILGYAGVSKRKNGFRVHLRGPNNTSINLPGTFPTAEAAAIARDVASMRLRGDMYGLNFAPHRTVTQLNDEDRIFVLNMMDKLFKGETTC